jgi:hypothetical protein
MTASEGFVSRWARRKREVTSKGGNGPRAEDSLHGSAMSLEPDPGVVDGASDLPELPPIGSIMANTDIRAFLQSRVPAELTRAALRQAWASDPTIRDFIGIAENQWDFNDPDAMSGFGALHSTDDVPALLRQALGKFEKVVETLAETPAVSEPVQPTTTADASTSLDRPDIQSESDAGGAETAGTAADHFVEEIDCLPERHSHGGALPR